VLAALGPRSLRLAGGRAAGSHPYLAVPAHTRSARQVLGPGPLLAPEQTVVVDADPDEARRRARVFLREPYLRLSNYVNNLLRHGYDQTDVTDGGSDRLIDDLVPHGTPAAVAEKVVAQLAAGADHVGIQVLPAPGQGPMPALRALAAHLVTPAECGTDALPAFNEGETSVPA
jgi:probable F420-dependent oxidoreductase